MFSEVCDDYYSRGLSVIPVKGKKVACKNFGQYSHRLPTKQEQEAFKKAKPKANIGLMLGRVNNIMCIDVDTDLEDVMNLIEKTCPQTPVAKFGKKGITKFYRTTLNFNESFCNIDHGCMLEFHGTSRQTVLPPSIHPETKTPYTWVGTSLLDGLDDIPIIDPKALAIIRGYMELKYKTMDLRSFIRLKRSQYANT